MSSRVETGDAGAEEGQRPEEWPPAALADRLGFLLKHAQIELAELAGPAVAPLGIVGRELAVLSVLADGGSLSQHQAARRLAIDRTIRVALRTLIVAAPSGRHPAR